MEVKELRKTAFNMLHTFSILHNVTMNIVPFTLVQHGPIHFYNMYFRRAFYRFDDN